MKLSQGQISCVAFNRGVVQSVTRWHDPAGTRDIAATLAYMRQPCDIAVLPEMFSTGFTMTQKVGGIHGWQHGAVAGARQSRVLGCVVYGFIIEDGGYFNRFIWATLTAKYSITTNAIYFVWRTNIVLRCAGKESSSRSMAGVFG